MQALLMFLVGLLAPAPAAAQTRLELRAFVYPADQRAAEVVAMLEVVGRGEIAVTAVAWKGEGKREQVISKALRTVREGQTAFIELAMSELDRRSGLFAIDQIHFLTPDFERAAKLRDAARPFIVQRLAEDGLALLAILPGMQEALMFFNEAPESLAAIPRRRFAHDRASQQRAIELLGGRDRGRGVVDSGFIQSVEIDAMLTSAATPHRHVPSAVGWSLLLASAKQLAALPAATRQAISEGAQRFEPKLWSDAAKASAAGRFADPRFRLAAPDILERVDEIARQMAAEWETGAGADGAAIIEAYRESVSKTP